MSKNTIDFERKALEGTPFIIQYSEAKGWSAGIAEYKLTGNYESETDLLEVLKGARNGQIDWDLLTSVIMILMDKTKKMAELEAEIVKQK